MTAWRTLTQLPIPGRDAAAFAQALPWFPAVGLLLGLVAALAAWAGTSIGWPMGGALLATLWLVYATGGLHLDGLGDTADGLYGGRPAARALEIMKDSRVGAMGVVAIALILLFKATALARLAEAGDCHWLPLPMVMGRYAMAQLVCTQPYARSEGGTAAPFFQGAGVKQLRWALPVTLCMGLALAGAVGVAAALLTTAVTWLLARWWRRRLGGITGDTLGCACELIETGLLWLLAAAAPWMGCLGAGLKWH
ncbi:MAG: adenosylcobinamide-GDP ribazoletransferase [Kiritimatiellae bacterium]|nr:adenosylcobinamide-GDP ribazoletransferase [Kiritimatiellia bacterium]